MVCVAAFFVGCSTTKHVPDGKMLLDKVKIKVDNDSVKTSELYNFLRQQPNPKTLGLFKLRLHTYSLSGSDSTKWYNRWLRRLGKPPVIYDEKLTEASKRQLQTALINKGYMDAVVTIDTIAQHEKKKIEVDYLIKTGKPHRISSISYNVPDTAVANVLSKATDIETIEVGELLDRNKLDKVRASITTVLRNNGYYTFNKEYITFSADTVKGSKEVALTLNLREQIGERIDTARMHERYKIRKVIFDTDYDPRDNPDQVHEHQDTVTYKGIEVIYGDDHYIKPSILYEKCHIRAGRNYSARNVDRTYEAISQLGIIKFVNIEMKPVAYVDGYEWLDAYIYLSRNQKQGVTFELEGTNSEGDLGVGVGVTYKHRNLAHGSELLTVKFRAMLESLSGKPAGLINDHFAEYAGEVGLTMPKFIAPFLSDSFKRRRTASTEFTISFNHQQRPEYTRIIAGCAWKYKWAQNRRGTNVRREFRLIDVNYVRLPESTINFLDSIAPLNPLLRYSYEDHFIMHMGYSYYRSNKRMPSATSSTMAFQPSVTTVRFNVEIAGNLLYAISKMIGQKQSEGAYKIFGIQYAQYFKADADYTYTYNFDKRNSIAFHVGGGICVPYLNSKMVPFEKRFYAGGANSVRGWSVRTLGPGSYNSTNSVTKFINQCGDILLNLNLEYRAKLFWVLEGALFLDAGNVWTIREYENQPGGVFKFNQFYKQIAASYGLGFRLDFTYFLLRFDMGMKAHNPAEGQEEWPLIHPNLRRDFNFNFSVGYPF